VSTDPRQQLIDAARRTNACGLNYGTSGNVSLRQSTGMLITPSGVPHADLCPGDIVPVSFDGAWEIGRKPSSEWHFHRDIYLARPDACAVVHAHPVYCAALACMRKDIPAFHYMVAVAGGDDIRCAPYATFGTQELSDHALQALAGRKACLLANHGLICLESSLSRALALAVEVENLAQIYCQCLSIAEPALLDRQEMARVIEKFKDYGAVRGTTRPEGG